MECTGDSLWCSRLSNTSVLCSKRDVFLDRLHEEDLSKHFSAMEIKVVIAL